MLRSVIENFGNNEDLNLNDFVEFKHKSAPRGSSINHEVIRYRIQKNKKIMKNRSLKIYFREKIATHMDIKTGDRVKVLHDAGNSLRIALIKVTDGTNAGCSVCSAKKNSSYYYFKLMIEKPELNTTEKIVDAKTVYHSNGRILFYISQ